MTRGDHQLSKLQDVYPELLGAAYLINTPWLVSTLMKLLYAVMTKQTMAKVRTRTAPHTHTTAHANLFLGHLGQAPVGQRQGGAEGVL
jgi:hypothetical protein